jgi:hypothetical protein
MNIMVDANSGTWPIPTIYYVNIRPNRHSEIPKSKATYSRAANIKTNGENIYRNTKNPTSYKRFCNNLHWVHLKSKVKQINIWDQENLSD